MSMCSTLNRITNISSIKPFFKAHGNKYKDCIMYLFHLIKKYVSSSQSLLMTSVPSAEELKGKPSLF